MGAGAGVSEGLTSRGASREEAAAFLLGRGAIKARMRRHRECKTHQRNQWPLVSAWLQEETRNQRRLSRMQPPPEIRFAQEPGELMDLTTLLRETRQVQLGSRRVRVRLSEEQ
jgi:hypothetical protein